MLVLSRRVSEKLVIGDGAERVVITVVRIDGGTVRLGVQAPREMLVLRSELVPHPKPGGDSNAVNAG